MKDSFNYFCTDPDLLSAVFLQLSEKTAASKLIFPLKVESALSNLFDLSSLQDSTRFRFLFRARFISQNLITDEGDLDLAFLNQFLEKIASEGHFFYPEAEKDYPHFIYRCLIHLTQKESGIQLKKFHTPVCHPWAEKLIRYTLDLPLNLPLTEVEVRRAVLCAYLTPLRQNVGSCFATAPAILIQKDQPHLLFNDFYQLLTTGTLKRTFGGVEYALPLSPSTGVGDLRKSLLTDSGASYCPGLLSACRLLNICVETDSIERQAFQIRLQIEEMAKNRASLTVEEFLQALCLKEASISQQELEREADLEKSQVHQFLSGGRGPISSSEKIRRIHLFKQTYALACETFNAICENALLKAWEFTLASFSEVKMEFSKWNFYTSLGFSPENKGGIGELLLREINQKIEGINKQLHTYQLDYQLAFDQLKTAEVLLRNAASESEGRRLRVEYQSRAYHLRSCQELRDTLYERGGHYSGLFSFLLNQYDQKFPDYFQEIYDAQMQDVAEGSYEDSPAGFRLVYKHGRIDPHSWTLIFNKDQYIHFLIEFFSLTQTEIAAACEWEEGEEEIRDLTAQILHHLRTASFLESALQRMAHAYQTPLSSNPLASLQKVEKKPWAYTSGGSMMTLLKTYYCREMELTTESKWVESAQDLLIFILDTLKGLPPRVLNPYLKEERTGLLMQSPTHAFILLPQQFKAGWQAEGFTYTWVRDEVVVPGRTFYQQMRLNFEEQAFLFESCSRFLALRGLSSPFFTETSLSVLEWRSQFLPLLPHTAYVDRLDAFLYQSLPLIPLDNWKDLAALFLKKLDSVVIDLKADPSISFFTASQFQDLIKSCYLLDKGRLELSFDLNSKVVEIARELGLAPPTPLLFADSNWVGNYFGFILNPGTGELDLWRMNQSMTKGLPMSQWRGWFNGEKKQAWTLFTQPHEYF